MLMENKSLGGEKFSEFEGNTQEQFFGRKTESEFNFSSVEGGENEIAQVEFANPIVSPTELVVEQLDGDSAMNTPETAIDGEAMEKVWVDKIKADIAETKGNPYERQKRIAGDKMDYLRKRFENRRDFLRKDKVVGGVKI